MSFIDLHSVNGLYHNWSGIVNSLQNLVKTYSIVYSGLYMKFITKTSLFKYTENFTTEKWKFLGKNSNLFFKFLLKT